MPSVSDLVGHILDRLEYVCAYDIVNEEGDAGEMLLRARGGGGRGGVADGGDGSETDETDAAARYYAQLMALGAISGGEIY